MRILAIMVTLMSSINLFGQVRDFINVPKEILERMPEMGKDCSAVLNNYESDYFNVIFNDTRKDFDFAGKKVGFITGSNAGTLSNKQKYFEKEKYRYAQGETPNDGTLYLFSTEEKEQSGGYDAVIVYWSKVSVSHKDLVEKLKTHKP